MLEKEMKNQMTTTCNTEGGTNTWLDKAGEIKVPFVTSHRDEFHERVEHHPVSIFRRFLCCSAFVEPACKQTKAATSCMHYVTECGVRNSAMHRWVLSSTSCLIKTTLPKAQCSESFHFSVHRDFQTLASKLVSRKTPPAKVGSETGRLWIRFQAGLYPTLNGSSCLPARHSVLRAGPRAVRSPSEGDGNVAVSGGIGGFFFYGERHGSCDDQCICVRTLGHNSLWLTNFCLTE